MKTVVTGGTGFIGTELCAALTGAGHEVAVISRDADRVRQTLGERVTGIAWDNEAAWRRAVAESDAVFHLAGASIAGERWTPEYKQTILDSRVRTTEAIVSAKPRLLLSASGVGYYGGRGDDVLTEDAPPGTDFLAEVCVAWEAEALKAEDHGGRVVLLRTGTTLGEDGGALESMIKPPMVPFSPWKFGLGGPLGDGNQWMSWIHVDDLVRLYLWCVERQEVRGPVNAVAPKPVRNRDFSHALGHAMNRPSLVPVPGFALELVVGEFAYALLYSQRVAPEKALKLGFTWTYPDIGPALVDIVREQT
ncbi:MAG: TIGR01777 family oxidoreductase [Armatimonadaceae bacterium]